ncbi:MAG TPA: GH1 family beta-glucosidase [Microbacteriaceae bacterium]|nr:GH1 family beta-glucosidase [Microbacteriaceae bacterium]
MSRFPGDFIWGSATAAAQIEGAAHEDGKDDSIWDAFARVPGAIANGDTPEVAVDHYHRIAEDVAIMRDLGLQAYRFSVSWPRVRPGAGAPNPAGIDFYSRLVDDLLGADILPWLTLYHWDLPQALQERGGWADRDTALRFAEYAVTVHEALGDRVTHWTTFNEPWCSSMLGYASGEHAPGRQSPAEAFAALHHQHLAHGLAVRALRERGVESIGITLNLTTAVPRDPADLADLDAARRIDGLFNRMYLEPLLLGRYPDDVLADIGAAGWSVPVQDGDLAAIRQPIDFLGVNHYHDDQVSGHPDGGNDGSTARPGRDYASPYPGSEFVTFPGRDLPRTGMGWEVNPAGLTRLLVRLGQEYGDALPPLYVTENGAAYDDIVTGDGLVHDAQRTEFILDHVAAIGDAIEQGADVRGYFVWSLLDNFEWAWGYDERFGIVRVDYDSLVRTVKDSGRAYAALIAAEVAVRG